MLYHLYEWTHAAVKPWRVAASMGRVMLNNPANPLSYTYQAKATSAALDVFDGLTRKYAKPEFGITEVSCHGGKIGITEEIVTPLPCCQLLHFKRDTSRLPERFQVAPKLLIVAPVSGHYATLLRGTVRALLEDFDVYITDWIDAREVPIGRGNFDLHDYIDYGMGFMRQPGPNLHVVAVCQPGPAVWHATAVLAATDVRLEPATVTVRGRPI